VAEQLSENADELNSVEPALLSGAAAAASSAMHVPVAQRVGSRSQQRHSFDQQPGEAMAAGAAAAAAASRTLQPSPQRTGGGGGGGGGGGALGVMSPVHPLSHSVASEHTEDDFLTDRNSHKSTSTQNSSKSSSSSVDSEDAPVIGIDDEADEDVIRVLFETLQDDRDRLAQLTTVETQHAEPSDVSLALSLSRINWVHYSAPANPYATLGVNFDRVYRRVAYELASMPHPATLAGMGTLALVPQMGTLQVCVLGSVLTERRRLTRGVGSNTSGAGVDATAALSSSVSSRDRSHVIGSPRRVDPQAHDHDLQFPLDDHAQHAGNYRPSAPVVLSTLSRIPGQDELQWQWLGPLDVHLIYESSTVKETGGSDIFVQRALQETLAVIRAHVAARGADHLLSLQVRNVRFEDAPHRNTVRRALQCGSSSSSSRRSQQCCARAGVCVDKRARRRLPLAVLQEG
jgi:hypothetical protein